MSVMKIISVVLSSFSLGFGARSLIVNLMNWHYDKKKNAELEKLKRDRETDLHE